VTPRFMNCDLLLRQNILSKLGDMGTSLSRLSKLLCNHHETFEVLLMVLAAFSFVLIGKNNIHHQSGVASLCVGVTSVAGLALLQFHDPQLSRRLVLSTILSGGIFLFAMAL
jgi:hypothetical protein